MRAFAALIAVACGTTGRNAIAQESPASMDQAGRAVSARDPASAAHVSVIADRPKVVLARFDFLGEGGKNGYYSVERICTAPCTAVVDPEGTYRLLAPHMTPSSPLHFSTRDSEVEVQGGSWRPFAAGVTFTAIGAAWVPTGGALLGLAEAGSSASRPALLVTGSALLGLGVIALSVGLPLWLGNRTKITMREVPSRTTSTASRMTPAGLEF